MDSEEIGAGDFLLSFVCILAEEGERPGHICLLAGRRDQRCPGEAAREAPRWQDGVQGAGGGLALDEGSVYFSAARGDRSGPIAERPTAI